MSVSVPSVSVPAPPLCYVYMHEYKHTSNTICVWKSECYYLGVKSLLLPSVLNQTMVGRLIGQVHLPAEPSVSLRIILLK